MSEAEAKALFFAQYLGQEILGCIKELDRPIKQLKYIRFEKIGNCDYLLLRSIDQLEDSEIINLLSILECSVKKEFKKKLIKGENKEWLRVWIEYTGDNGQPMTDIILNLSNDKNMISNCRGNDYYRTLSVAKDYLTRIGVLTSFTYVSDEQKPITLTTTDLLEKDWCKLIEK